MWMIVKIGWRNLWRNKRRSLITLGAIVVGLWGLVLIYGANNGMLLGMVDMTIMANTSHIQIHAKGYHDNPEMNLNISDPSVIEKDVDRASHVEAVAPRARVRAMVSTATSSQGVVLMGIDPQSEAKVTTVAGSIVSGRYFNEDDQRGVLIGKDLADKLKTGTGRKIVAYARSTDNELKALGLKVIGTYDTGTDEVDKYMAFIPLKFFQDELGMDGKVHEFAIKIDSDQNLGAAKAAIIRSLPKRSDLEVMSWKEMFAFLVQLLDFASISNYIMLGIVGIAMALGIANTMIMSVFERFRELGIMKAVGTRPGQIFLMVLVEAVCLALVGLVLGSLAGWVSIKIWAYYGLDLTAFSESMQMMGVPAIIYPMVFLKDWVVTWIAVVLMAVGACIYPAIKAARKNPVEAMRM